MTLDITNSRPPDWTERALCSQIGGEMWFPEKGESARPAIENCNKCEVREQCLQYALDNDERHGVWGGVTERQRRKLKPRACKCGNPAPKWKSWCDECAAKMPHIVRRRPWESAA